MKSRMIEQVKSRGRCFVYGAEAVKIAKSLMSKGYTWLDCTTAQGYQQGILSK